MKAAPIPKDEAQRLAALRALQIFRSERETKYDWIVQEAAVRVGVPIALITIVEAQTQWVKACHGLEVPEIPRDICFCAHALSSDDILVVEDTLLDDRFHDNPLVTGAPGIRFYAGAAIQAPDHQRIGALVAIDTQPRSLSPEQRQHLYMLRSLVNADLAQRLQVLGALTTR